MGLLELPDFAVGAPAQIAVPGVAQIGMRDRFKAACSIEPCGEFVGDALVLDEPVLTRQPNGLFVETLGFQFSAFEACANTSGNSAERKANWDIRLPGHRKLSLYVLGTQLAIEGALLE